MLNLLISLFARLFGTQEPTVVDALFLAAARRRSGGPDQVGSAIEELAAHLASDQFSVAKVTGRRYVSKGGGVKICYDIFGPEVRLVPRIYVHGLEPGLLDCAPDSYGLTSSEATRLYEAILSGHKCHREQAWLKISGLR
jgi:hypothetical protein